MTLYSVKIQCQDNDGYEKRHKEIVVPLVDLLSSLSLPEFFSLSFLTCRPGRHLNLFNFLNFSILFFK